jgi:hypothetical protein
MSLNVFPNSSSCIDENSTQQPGKGLTILNEIERLQNHVLQELEDLDERIQSVFKAFGYRETEPLAPAANSHPSDHSTLVADSVGKTEAD